MRLAFALIAVVRGDLLHIQVTGVMVAEPAKGLPMRARGHRLNLGRDLFFKAVITGALIVLAGLATMDDVLFIFP